jgi:hypothetical protein
VIDAAARGAGEGMTLAFNVGAMLLAFIALIAMLNAILGVAAGWLGLEALLQGWGALAAGQSLTLEIILGWLLAPLAWVMGVPWADAVAVGSLLGIKTVANEFVAYLRLADLLPPERCRPDPSSLPRTPWPASPTSAPSPSRSAGSAASRPRGAATCPGSACAPWSVAPWRPS